MREPGEDERRRGYLPSATRHLLLIRYTILPFSKTASNFGYDFLLGALYPPLTFRHGQYNLQGTNDKERSLTDLGKEQAAVTAARSSQNMEAPQNISPVHMAMRGIIPFNILLLQAGYTFSSLLAYHPLKHDKVVDHHHAMLKKTHILVCDICRAIETAEIVAAALPNIPVLPV